MGSEDYGVLRDELRRLESLVNQSIGATRGLSEKVQTLSEELRMTELKRLNDKENADKTAAQMKELTRAINALNETFAEANGKAQGVSATAKAFWVVTGTIVTASIFWATNTIVDLKSTVAVLQSRIEK